MPTDRIVWVESNFKQASERDNPAEAEFVGVLRDVTERKRMEDELNLLNRRLTQLAATDGLTGLTNRRTFDGFLAREYEACEEISVLLFDIDNFKGYNDTYGHQAGDRCLQAVAKVDRRCDLEYVRPVRALWRRGIRRRAAEHFRRRCIEGRRIDPADRARPRPSQHRRHPRLSSPSASALPPGPARRSGEAALVGEADVALYEAKRLGRNRSIVYSSLVLRYVEAGSIQHDPELAPGERKLAH